MLNIMNQANNKWKIFFLKSVASKINSQLTKKKKKQSQKKITCKSHSKNIHSHSTYTYTHTHLSIYTLIGSYTKLQSKCCLLFAWRQPRKFQNDKEHSDFKNDHIHWNIDILYYMKRKCCLRFYIWMCIWKKNRTKKQETRSIRWSY